MATRPASKLNLQELGIPDEIELVDKQGRIDLASLTQRVDDITPPDNIDISEDGVKVYANYDVNELGWGCEDKTYYFDTAAEFSLGDRTYTKTNAKPAFGGVIGTPGDGQNHAIVLVSTEADATYFSWNSTAHSFDYNGTTWYYCGGNYAYWGSPTVGISVIPDGTLSLEDAARYMLDSAQVYVDDGKFSEIAEPNSGYLFAGGGSQDDYSDAIFKVSKEGVVTAQDVEINGESITDKIDNIIDDTTTDTDTTWSSNKITEEIEDKTSVTKTASGNPIEITDGANAPLVKCVTAIQGNQDLHGYDKPWVGGSGKNKLPMTVDGIKVLNISGTWSGNSYTVNGVTFSIITDNGGNVTGIKANGTASDTVILIIGTYDVPAGTYTYNGCPSGGSLETYYQDWRTESNVQRTDIGNGNTYTFTTASGGRYARIIIVSGVTMSNLTFAPMIRASTETADFEPYSNICPITAYAEGKIEVRGKNLVEETYDSGNINANGVVVANQSGYDLQIGKVKEGATYTITSNELFVGAFYYTKPTTGSVSYNGSRLADVPKTFTSPITGYVAFRTVHNYATPQLEVGSTATDYEPYKSTSHTATFPSAIFRGSEDVVKGEVKSEWGMKSYDGSESWYSHTSSRWYLNQLPTKLDTENKALSISNQALYGDFPGVFESYFSFGSTGIYVAKLSSTETLEQFKSRLSSENMVIAYPLATPTTETITPTNLPIKSLFGYNHIESSTGDMEVEYITEEFQPLVDLIQESGGDSHTYSTTEQVVGKWIDGSTIYEKTIYDVGGQSGAVTFAHGISNFGKLISIEGNCYDNQENAYMPFPRVGPDGNNIGIVSVDSTNVQYAVAGAFATRVVDVYLTIRYTKTTTQTNSFSISNSETDQVDDVLDTDSDTDTEDA